MGFECDLEPCHSLFTLLALGFCHVWRTRNFAIDLARVKCTVSTRASREEFRPFEIQEEQQPTGPARRFTASPAPVGRVGQPIWQENDR
jgi:hypothetical protein